MDQIVSHQNKKKYTTCLFNPVKTGLKLWHMRIVKQHRGLEKQVYKWTGKAALPI